MLPAGRRLYSAPIAWAASSITASLCSRGDRQNRIHVGALAEQMDRHDGLGGRGDGRFDQRRIDVECGRIDVDEDRLAAQPRHGRGRGKKRVAGQDHFVAGPDVQRHQRQQDRVAARGAGDRVRHVAIRGDRLFQRLAIRPKHEAARCQHPPHGRGDFCGQRLILPAHVDQAERPRCVDRASRGIGRRQLACQDSLTCLREMRSAGET